MVNPPIYRWSKTRTVLSTPLAFGLVVVVSKSRAVDELLEGTVSMWWIRMARLFPPTQYHSPPASCLLVIIVASAVMNDSVWTGAQRVYSCGRFQSIFEPGLEKPVKKPLRKPLYTIGGYSVVVVVCVAAVVVVVGGERYSPAYLWQGTQSGVIIPQTLILPHPNNSLPYTYHWHSHNTNNKIDLGSGPYIICSLIFGERAAGRDRSEKGWYKWEGWGGERVGEREEDRREWVEGRWDRMRGISRKGRETEGD